MRPVLLLVFAVLASSVWAQEWDPVRGVNTAELAATGWHQVGAVSVTIGGLADILTFWEGEIDGTRVTLRCFTTFRQGSDQTTDWCEQPTAAEEAPIGVPDSP